MSDSDLTSASLTPQSPDDVELADRAAIAGRLVELDEPGGHGLARHHLQLRIERGAHRQAAFIELLLAVALEDVAADFLGEIFAGEDVRGVAAAGDGQRILARLVGVGLLDPAVFQQAIDHVIAALDGAVAVAHRMQRRRRLRQRREIGRFRDREFVHRLVEIDQRGGGDAVGAEAEIDFVEIELEDLVLRIGALDPHRQQGFLDLAGERHFVGQQEVLGDLLGDGGGALRSAVGAVILRVEHRGARHAREVDAAMLVEVLVLGGEERVDDHLRHRLDRQIQPALLGVFAEQRAVGRMDARHHRRLVILQLRIVRQVLGKMPDQPCHGGDADQEHDGSGGEQEAHEPQQQAHCRSSVPTLAPQSPALPQQIPARRSAVSPGRI